MRWNLGLLPSPPVFMVIPSQAMLKAALAKRIVYEYAQLWRNSGSGEFNVCL
jgi:hypothetical protein